MDCQIQGRKEKTVIKITQYSMQVIYEQIFDLRRTTVPYGVKAQGHAAGTNQREKARRLLQGRNTLHAQGQTGEPQRRKFPKKTGISSKWREKRYTKTRASLSELLSRWFSGTNPPQGT